MGCGVFWETIGNIDKTLLRMRRLGLEGNPAYNRLWSVRGRLMGQIGMKIPRQVLNILRLFALSPGQLGLWFDVESGWMVEARRFAGAPPVYKAVSDDIAAVIIKGELTHELEESLMAPDDYLGE